jgi:hypothetical protein
MALTELNINWEDFNNLCEMIENDPNWERVRKAVQKAIDSTKKNVTLEEAEKQIKRFKNEKQMER